MQGPGKSDPGVLGDPARRRRPPGLEPVSPCELVLSNGPANSTGPCPEAQTPTGTVSPVPLLTAHRVEGSWASAQMRGWVLGP